MANQNSMKENIKMTRNVGRECLFGNQEINIVVTFLMTYVMDMEKCIGKMAQHTR